MARVIGIDYGLRRVGFAVSDSLGMIANPLLVADNKTALLQLLQLLEEYACNEVVIGLSKNLKNEDNPIEQDTAAFIASLLKRNPRVQVHRMDERFTSKIAMQSLVAGAFSKKQRRDKGNLDKMSAAILLQDFLDARRA
jgi:putative Holliday junction resolvase